MSETVEELVSVIVPAWNAERHIGRTLQSIAAQTHRCIEILVVDDGSTDRTFDLAEDFAQRDRRVRVLRQSNKGPAAARNHGAAEARGAFLAPCDSDDLWHPEKISRQLAAMCAASPEVGMVYSWSVGIDDEDRIIFPDWGRRAVTGNGFHRMIEDNLPGSGSSALIRREVFAAVGGYPLDLRYGDEWQLHIAVAAEARCEAVPAYLVAYRLRHDSITSNVEGVAADLAATTRWIERKWPDVPPQVLDRRAHVISNYLAFLFLRRREFGKACRCRLAAWRRQPGYLLTVEPWDFILLVLGELAGVERYYHRFWRKPRSWTELMREQGG
jgi:glycosyltransferase involved in cell wall biosynthesis